MSLHSGVSLEAKPNRSHDVTKGAVFVSGCICQSPVFKRHANALQGSYIAVVTPTLVCFKDILLAGIIDLAVCHFIGLCCVFWQV